MNRIDETFKRLKKENKKAFIVYLTSGYPDLEITEKLVLELDRRGVSIIELGVPFSDPLADGVTIQEASSIALRNNINLDKIISSVKKLRKKVGLPLVLMTYYNPVFQYGLEKLAREAAKAGVDGMIVPDLPPEEASYLKNALEKYGLSLIFLLASNAPVERMKIVTEESTGFVYCLSHIGITGTKGKLESGLKPFLDKMRKITDKPFVVGFGISAPGQVHKVNRWADGVVVGSAIIDAIKRNLGKKNLVKKVGGYVTQLMEK